MENTSKRCNLEFVKVEELSEYDLENSNEINDRIIKIDCEPEIYPNIKEETVSSSEEEFDTVKNISNSVKSIDIVKNISNSVKSIKTNPCPERNGFPQNQEEEINVALQVSRNVEEDVDLSFNSVNGKFHECDICNKVYTKANTLKIHKRIHTGVKPYPCDICSKCFTKASTLTDHKRIHTGEKPYRCIVCDKTFSVSGDLRKHSRVHSGEKPYRCDICLKRFTVASSLSCHKRIHSDVRPYQCEVCNKSFRRSYALTIHKRIHSKEKPFARSSNLHTHTRIVHAKDN